MVSQSKHSSIDPEDGRGLSFAWLPLAWVGVAFTYSTFRLVFPVFSISPRAVASALGISDNFILGLLIYKIWTLLAVAALYGLLQRKGIPLSSIGLHGRISFKEAGYAVGGAAVAVFMYLPIEALVNALGMSMYWAGRTREVPVSLSSSMDVAFTFSLSVVFAPILEETLYRGYVLTVFLERTGKTLVALLLNALIFASIHVAFGPGIMLYIFFWAFIPSLLYLKFKNLYPGMLMHSLNNLWAYIALPLLLAR